MNKVELKFDERITALAGEAYRTSIYAKQIKGKVDCHKKFILEFPEKYI